MSKESDTTYHDAQQPASRLRPWEIIQFPAIAKMVRPAPLDGPWPTEESGNRFIERWYRRAEIGRNASA